MFSKSSRYFVCFALAVVCALGISSEAAFAQAGSQGTVQLTAVDSTGAVIPGAKLELVEKSTNSRREGMSESNGSYTFVGLPIGTYSLRVSKAGYSTQMLQTIVVQA